MLPSVCNANARADPPGDPKKVVTIPPLPKAGMQAGGVPVAVGVLVALSVGVGVKVGVLV